MKLFLKPTKLKVLTAVFLFLITGIVFFLWLCTSDYSVSLSTKCIPSSNPNIQSYIPQPLNISTTFADINADIAGKGCMGIAAYDPSSQLASNTLTVLLFLIFVIFSYLISAAIFFIMTVNKKDKIDNTVKAKKSKREKKQ